MLYIGVDLGTSAVKLLLMDENGKIKTSYQRSIRFRFRIQDGRNKTQKTGLKSQWKESGN